MSEAYTVSIYIAFLSSLISFRLDRSFHLRLLSLLLGLTIVVETYAVFLMDHKLSNHFLYNVFALTEYWIFAMFFSRILRNKTIRVLIDVYLVVLPLAGIILVLWLTPNQWKSYLFLLGSLFTLLMSLFYYYQIFTQSELVPLKECSEFWIATGLIIFNACTFLFTGMLNYWVAYHTAFSKEFSLVYKGFNIIMYSTFSYAFLCRINTMKLFSSR